MGLEEILAEKRKTAALLKKKPATYEETFSEYERGVLGMVGSEKGQRYHDIFMDRPRRAGSREEPGASYVKPGATGRDLHEQQAAQRAKETQGPGTYTGPSIPHLVTKDYMDTLITESDRWKETGSRYVMPSTEISRRKEYMGKRYTGNLQGMSGVLGGAATRKKKLLGA